jgi:uncharacterized integral membrane protein
MRRDDDLGPNDPERDREGQRPPETVERSGISGRQVLIAVCAALLIAFAIANFDTVKVNFLLFDTEARLVTVVAVAGGLGFLLGWLIGRPSREERRHLRRWDRRHDD